MRKEYQAIAIVLVGVLLFAIGFGVGGVNNINVGVEGGATQQVVQQTTQTTTQPTTQTTTQATTESTTAAQQGGTSDTTAATNDTTTQAAQTGTKVPSTPEEVCAAYNKAVNDYRAYKGKVTLHKVENTKVEITELPALAKALEGTINNVISNIVKPVDETFTFENGVDVNEPSREIGHKMIPWGRDASVTPADVVSATATANADGGYTITLKFVSETATFDGTTSTEPVHHKTAMDPLNLATLDVDPITISSANMTYPGATTTLTVDSQGRMVELKNSLPLEGKGKGGALGINAEIGLAGQMDSTYTITW